MVIFSLDVESIIIAGLGTAFWVNLMVRSAAAPGWLKDLRSRGKPWSCPVCMSFWVATVLWLIVLSTNNIEWLAMYQHGVLVSTIIEQFFAVSAVAMISLLVIAVLDRISPEVFVIPQKK